MNNFEYSKRDLIVAGVAMGIIVAVLGLGFGLTKAASISTGLNFKNIIENVFGL